MHESFLDATTTVSALRSRCRAFCDARDWRQFHTPKDLAIGLAIEAAEILELFRFKKEETIAAELKEDACRERLADEMADVLYFLLMLAENTEMDLAPALERKLLKNEQKYPVDLAYGRNVKYTELTTEPSTPYEGVGTQDPAVKTHGPNGPWTWDKIFRTETES